MSPLPGFRQLPGRAERYMPPPGWKGRVAKDGSISRRQYENHRLRAYGWRTWSEYQHDADTDDWVRWRGEYKHVNQGDPMASYRGPDSEFAQAYLVAKRSGWSTDAHGPFADLLVMTGHRELDWDWDVGDTNEALA